MTVALRAFRDELACAGRGLARAPGFAALAVGVLSLGLGAVVFMYGVVDAMLLRPPPYPQAEQLYYVNGRRPDTGLLSDTVSLHDYSAMRDAGLPVEAIGAVYSGTVYLTGEGPAERFEGGFVTASVFDVVGIGAALGRVIQAADERPGARPVVVLGDGIWRERFDADPDVLGRRVRVNGVDTEIVGVMPPGFSYPVHQQLWLPTRQDASVTPEHESVGVMVMLRLAQGVTAEDVQEALVPVARRRLAEGMPMFQSGGLELVSPGASWVGETGRQLLWGLLAAVGLVLLIACANVSNLLLARAAWRIRETSVRSALGATRSRLVLHVVAESALITLSATAIGLLLAALALDAIRVPFSNSVEAYPPWIDLAIHPPVVLAALAAAFGATLLAGLPAALRATQPSLDAMLRDGGRAGTGRAAGRMAWSLVVAEVALAAAVLGGAALMTRTVHLVTHVDLGIDSGELMTARVGIPTAAYMQAGHSEDADLQRLGEFSLRYVEQLEAQPEIEAGGLTQMLPGHGFKRGWLEAEGVQYASPDDRPDGGGVSVSPSFFATLRLQPLQGRLFDATDAADSERVVVINESLARAAWPDGMSPIGRRLRMDQPGEPWRTVIGVVPDVLANVERGRMEPVGYVPLSQAPQRFVSVVVRGEGGPAALAAAMQRALVETDPGLALYWIRTFDESLALRTAGFRFIGGMFAAFGLIALVLAAAGLYGVLTFHVGQRTREIGLRRALGATDGRILGLLSRTTGAQVALGLALGLAAVPVLEAILDSMLTWLSPGSAWVYVGVLAVMLVVAVAAVARPTWVALRIDPAAALRHE
ncbi:MAG: ADOP family duplicated permease [Steroidobacteraceae bacterium]|nr:ADOP family duplicated permease [Steroidobacteraceae bacterium]